MLVEEDTTSSPHWLLMVKTFIAFCAIVLFFADIEIRNIIDKLAVFVARNGSEFERMTMNKQRNNPKFYFIFGGEFHPYYRWKVSQEQAGGWSNEWLYHYGSSFL